jgi:hypothetical protein
MAVQSASGIAGAIPSLLLQNIFRSTLSSFQQAQRKLTSERQVSPRVIAEGFLKSRIATLGAIMQVDQLQKSKADLAVSGLQAIANDLDQITSLAAAAASETDPTQRALLQSQATAVIGSIRSSMNHAVKNDPNLTTRVIANSDSLVANVRILSQSKNIKDEGIDATFALTSIGSRAKLANAIRTNAGTGIAGQLNNDISFQIVGPDGSATITALSGETPSDIIARVNAFTDVTGVFANLGSTHQVDFLTVRPYEGQITLVELSADPGNQMLTEISNPGISTAGTAMVGTLTVDGVSIDVEITDGKDFSFDVGGVSGIIEFGDPDVYIEALGTNTVGGDILGVGASTTTMRIYGGGRAILGADGKLLGRVSVDAYDFSNIARAQGGLDAIDLINDPVGALAIISAAQLDVGKGVATASFIANGLLGSRIAENAEKVGGANRALSDIDSVYEALAMFDRIKAESQLNMSLALLSQLTMMFPLTGNNLL